MARELFCPHCVSPVEEQDETCPECHFDRPAAGWPGDEHVGRLIANKYEITERLGEGGFGVVYRARQIKGDHDLGDVVLKLLRPNYCVNKSIRRRFVDEARAARSLDTPHVVKVFDFDFDERGLPFLVMEYLRGKPLDLVIDKGPLEPKRVVNIAMQLAEAMQDCHHAGILHRDLKPSNILLQGRNDFVKVLDFGIARMPDSAASQTLLGTPMYMAPEQILRQPIDKRVDIYALGVVLFECFAGTPPQDTSDENVALGALRPLRQVAPDLPKSLERLLAKMMAERPSQRPPTMADVRARLHAIASAQGWLTGDKAARVPDNKTVRAGPASRRKQRAATNDRARRRRIVGIIIAAIGVVVAGGVIVAAVTGSDDGDPPKTVVQQQPDAARSTSTRPDASIPTATTKPVVKKGPPDAAVTKRRRPSKVRRGAKGRRRRPWRRSHRKRKDDYSPVDGGL